MTLRQFHDWQTMGGGSDVSTLVRSLEELQIPWRMIGGLAAGHWAHEPMATADVDPVIAAGGIEDAVTSLKAAGFSEERFDRSIGMKGQSRVSIRISTEDLYGELPSRSAPAVVHGILMRVAGLGNALKGKIAAYSDPARRPGKRQKDLTDLSRLIEAHPQPASPLPQSIIDRLEH